MVVQNSRVNQMVTQIQNKFTNHKPIKKNQECQANQRRKKYLSHANASCIDYWITINTNYTRSSIQIDETMRPTGHCMMQILVFANFLGLNKKGSKHSAKMTMNAI